MLAVDSFLGLFIMVSTKVRCLLCCTCSSMFKRHTKRTCLSTRELSGVVWFTQSLLTKCCCRTELKDDNTEEFRQRAQRAEHLAREINREVNDECENDGRTEEER